MGGGGEAASKAHSSQTAGWGGPGWTGTPIPEVPVWMGSGVWVNWRGVGSGFRGMSLGQEHWGAAHLGGAEDREVGSWGYLLPAPEAPTLYTRVHGRRGDPVGWVLQLLLWGAGLDSHWPMSLAVRTTSLGVGNPISSPPSSYTTCPLCPPAWPPSTFPSFPGHLFPLNLPV